MIESKLILVEGLPGSGKTTTALFVADWLAQKGVDTAVYLEGDLNHPADFESVACLESREYAALKGQFPAEADFLDGVLIKRGEDHFFHYRHLEQRYPHLPAELIAALARYEIYELPVKKYQRLVRGRWQEFANDAAAGNAVYIFECCFIQNPLTMMMGRHDETAEDTQRFVRELAEIVRPLSPRWLYLQTADIQATVEQVARQRPQAWLDFVIAYHTQQGHGRAEGWQGFEGLIHFYKMRQAVELALLPKLPFPGLLIAHTTWVEDQTHIADIEPGIVASLLRIFG